MEKKDKYGELLEHNYDGIRELDNVLPPWWLYLFYFTIVIGVVYLFYYNILGIGDSQAQEYEHEMQAAAAQKKALAAAAPAAESFTEMTILKDEASLEKGKKIYITNCAACHGQNGEGGIGPNMTDNYWLHGNSIQELLKIINDGVPDKGMIPWKGNLTPKQMQEVASYILVSLHGTNPPNAKAPQGTLYE